MIEWNIVQVGSWEAMNHLKPRLDGYRRHGSRVFIGVTSEPQPCSKQHAREGWDRMVVSYEALSPDIATALERDLITYARQGDFKLPIANVDEGGDAARAWGGKYYLYFLLRAPASTRAADGSGVQDVPLEAPPPTRLPAPAGP